MREGSKTLIAALAVLLVCVGLTACGSDSSTNSTAAKAEDQGQGPGKSAGTGSKQESSRSDGKSDSQAGQETSGGSPGQSGGSPGGGGTPDGGSAADFVPKQHKDSGGGSKPYRVKGGDNSVQDFGSEADSAEFKAAATALHNYLDARAEDNWDAACQYMSKEMIKSFEQLAAAAKQIKATTCGAIVAGLTNPASKGAMKAEAETADVRSLRTDGDRSFIIYTASGDILYGMPMRNEDGAWKVGGLTGTPLN